MTDSTSRSHIAHRWYTRPIFFVADVNRAARFYVETLGFEKGWHADDGMGKVCQVQPYLPGEQDADDLLMRVDLAEAIERYTTDRARLVARLRQLAPADWARTALHAEYREYSVFIMCLFDRGHRPHRPAAGTIASSLR